MRANRGGPQDAERWGVPVEHMPPMGQGRWAIHKGRRFQHHIATEGL